MSHAPLEISAKTRVMGLIGESIEYSLSPLIHNESARELGIDARYLCFSAAANSVKSFLDAMWSVGALGFNITQPHKELVASLIPGTQPISVNTIYRGSEYWLAESTDGIGLCNALLRSQVNLLSFKRIVIVGSGGAAMSVAEFLQQHRYQGEVVFAVRSDLGEIKLKRFPDLRIVSLHQRSEALLALLADSSDILLIQATSAPFKSDRMEWLLPQLQKFCGVYVDMTYATDSAPLDFCKQKGLRAMDGIAMLIEQARASQQLWWGRTEDFDSIELRLRTRSQ